jgi:hypothetical protein
MKYFSSSTLLLGCAMLSASAWTHPATAGQKQEPPILEVKADNRCGGAEPAGKILRGPRLPVEGDNFRFISAQKGFNVLSLELDDEASAEKTALRAAGFAGQLISTPYAYFDMGIRKVDGGKQYIDDGFVDAVAALAARGRQGMYVHCTHGKDRTGLVIALYRVAFQCWSPAEARAEYLKIQSWHRFFQPRKHDYFDQVTATPESRLAFKQRVQAAMAVRSLDPKNRRASDAQRRDVNEIPGANGPSLDPGLGPSLERMAAKI